MSANYKNIKINFATFKSIIEEWADRKKAQISVEKMEKIANCEKIFLSVQGKKLILRAHYKTDSVSIVPEGVNLDLTKSLADFIVAESEKKLKIFNKDFSLKIEQVDWNVIEKIIQTQFNPELLQKPIGSVYSSKINKPVNVGFCAGIIIEENLTLKYYSTGTFQMQGKTHLTFFEIIEIITPHVDAKLLIEAQLKTFSAGNLISAEESLEDLKENISCFSHLKEDITTIMAPAITLSKIDSLELTDYSVIVFPILRGLEGILKQIFIKAGHTFNRDGFKNIFSAKKMTEDYKKKFQFALHIQYIEEMYALYYDYRHQIFHMDDGLLTTYQIENRKDALDLLSRITTKISACPLPLLK